MPGRFRLPMLLPRRTHTAVVEDVARRRGIFTVGPVAHLRTDPLGLFRRTTRWGEPGVLWVRPRVLVPNSFVDGGVFDLEGLPSDQLSTSDLAFHALREYVPGDDLRSVHWRSSAKANTLLVRQYVESRAMHAAFVVDDDPTSYADPEEFELAVSVAASMALRALADGFQVDLVCGERSSAPIGPNTLLDECCHFGLHVHQGGDDRVDVVRRTGLLARRRALVGVGVVVTGSACDDKVVFEASTSFGPNTRRFVVRAESEGEAGVSVGPRRSRPRRHRPQPALPPRRGGGAVSTRHEPGEDAAAASLDVLAVIVLALLALTGLQGSYRGLGYLAVGAVALAVATSWALVCVAQRWSASVYLLVLLLIFPLVGAWTVFRNVDWLGLPSASAVGRVVTASITGPAEFLTTIPPLDSRGDVLIIPFVLGYLLGAAAIALALWTRRPLLPGVPLLLVLVACLLLGTDDPGQLLLRGIAFGVLLVLWVSVREARGTADEGDGGLVLRRVLTVAAVLVAGVLATLAVPGGQQQERAVLRGRVGSGQDVSQLDNPLATFRNFTAQSAAGATANVASKRLLAVKGLPRGEPVRIVALDTYDGSTWSAGNRTVPGDSGSLFQRIATEVVAPREGRPARVTVEVKKAWSSSWLPLAGELTGITFDFLDGRAQRDDVRYNLATQTGMVVGGLALGDDFTFTAALPDRRVKRSAAPYGDGDPLVDSGQFADRYLRPWRESGLAPMGQVFSLARYLRINGRYSDGGPGAERRYLPGHGELRLGTQFFGASTIVGNDEQYSAFMALAANRLGVPARVVVGARAAADGTVRGRDVEAWVELRVADGSWRTLPNELFMSHKPPKRSDVRQSVESYVQTTVRPDEPDQTQRPPDQQPPQAKPLPAG